MRQRLVTVVRYPSGPRVWIAGQRVHHGATGLLLAAILRRHRRAAAACLLLAAHDRRDWRVWFVREKSPASSIDRAARTL